jgi:Predicted membrane protein/domain
MRSSGSQTTAGTDNGMLLRRGAALAVDAALVAAVFGLAALASSLLVGVSLLAWGWTLPVAYLGYHVFFEGTSGRTPGKRVFGLVVLGRDGLPCGLRAAIIRTLLRVVDGAFFYLVGATAVVLTDGDRRLGDAVAGTRVVKTSRR